jgi:pimeloyl-ACP methyl ester carboxylesterase
MERDCTPLDSVISQKILTIPNLKDLQKKDNINRISLSRSLWKYINNDLYTDFEKDILQLKPSDCSIVQKYSKIETFPIINNNHLNEISISTIYIDHPLREFHKRSIKDIDENDFKGIQLAKEQIDKIETLPVLIFIHGLGGQVSQFEPILKEFRNCADIFGFDLPGFGNSKRPSRNNEFKNLKFSRLSKFTDKELEKLEESLNNMRDEDFETDNLVEILFQILNFKFPNRRFIFIAHSMGSHLSIKLINKLPKNKVETLIMISPPNIKEKNIIANDDSDKIINRIPFSRRVFLNTSRYFPRFFDYFRFFDRYGGLYSKSVESFIYSDLNGEEEGEDDDDLLKRLTQFRWNLDTDSIIFLKYLFGFKCVHKIELLKMVNKLNCKKILLLCGQFDKITPNKDSINIKNLINNNNNNNNNNNDDDIIIYEEIPNANHSIFLDKPNLLAGSIYKFIEELNLNISCTWVLQIKAIISGDKWGLKNENKWNKVITLSKPIINEISPNKPKSYLLGMKTLRQTDKIHNPIKFEEIHPEIFGIIDIGSDTPSYEPLDFKRIKYVKYKTESKITPDDITIVKFLEIVDNLMKDRDNKEQFIVVHCHYGQNRTGFLICCYLIEKLGWSVNEATNAFEISKPPGIKHVHFKNALHLRYNE